jgi:hypothetical protein
MNRQTRRMSFKIKKVCITNEIGKEKKLKKRRMNNKRIRKLNRLRRMNEKKI